MLRNLILKASLVIASCAIMSHAEAFELKDVTKNWIFRYNIVSAFPATYERVPKEENADIIRVYHYQLPAISEEAGQRRIEMFYTGGDWMQYGLTYFVSNAENPEHKVFPDKSAAYFIAKLSTTDRENGSVAPAIDPMDKRAVENFILKEFLNEDGKVKTEFSPL